MRQLLYFPGRHALHKGFLHYLYEHRFTALALCDEERNVAALTNLGHHEVHRAHSGIQAARTITATVAASSVRALTFFCAQLLIDLGLLPHRSLTICLRLRRPAAAVLRSFVRSTSPKAGIPGLIRTRSLRARLLKQSWTELFIIRMRLWLKDVSRCANARGFEQLL